MEDDPKKKKRRKKKKKKWNTNQSTEINLVGCDTIVNSPSFVQKTHDQRATLLQDLSSGQTVSWLTCLTVTF